MWEKKNAFGSWNVCILNMLDISCRYLKRWNDSWAFDFCCCLKAKLANVYCWVAGTCCFLNVTFLLWKCCFLSVPFNCEQLIEICLKSDRSLTSVQTALANWNRKRLFFGCENGTSVCTKTTLWLDRLGTTVMLIGSSCSNPASPLI